MKVSFILRFFAKNATLFRIFLRENERKIRKMEDWMKSPMNSVDAANYMKKNFEMAKNM